MASNSFQSVRVRQKSILLKRLKKVSFVLICLATLLLIVDIVDVKMVFGKNEAGLFDQLPGFFRETMFLAYPILLVTSYVLFIVTRNIKSKFDLIPNILFLLNGLVIVFLLAFCVIVFAKHL